MAAAVTIWRAVRYRPRLVTGVVSGVIAWMLLPPLGPWVTRAVVAWDIGVVVFLGCAALLFTTEAAAQMPENAAREQEGEWTIFFFTLAAAVVSFVAIFGVFANSKDLPPELKSLRVVVVSITLFASWLMTHVTFAFRYAHEYYSRDETPPSAPPGTFDGGLDFPGEKRPDYLDFMYFALVLGMTFQVSDVQITSRKLRRLATLHGLVGFLYNTVILALTVNIAAGLL